MTYAGPIWGPYRAWRTDHAPAQYEVIATLLLHLRLRPNVVGARRTMFIGAGVVTIEADPSSRGEDEFASYRFGDLHKLLI